ncbi:MAG: ribonuclease HII [Aquificaceae bacterium]|nr:ribonuclease HII [Aquificaceae bacterium]MDW8237145.1 ribonuclease HII [Aquificaceae bacterium]
MGAKEEVIPELSYWQDGSIVVGVDEVGRGAIAGPIVACAVALKPFAELPLRDSKKLSKSKRKEFSLIIRESSLSVGIGVVDSALVDSIGISSANRLAMIRALEDLKVEFDIVISDYFDLDGVNCISFAKADEKSLCCAAASVVAKTLRDEIMHRFSEIFDRYSFEKNVGYPTKTHIMALRSSGPCDIHRFSFRPLKELG